MLTMGALRDQCRFVSYNKHSTLAEEFNNIKSWMYGGIWKISIHFPQFFCEIKSILKLKL